MISELVVIEINLNKLSSIIYHHFFKYNFYKILGN